MIFQEITKPALQRAMQNLTHLNMDRVKSQQARQILDIYLGYKVSPVLWKYVQHKLSAGRCQTPALQLVYDNELEFGKLSQETHFHVKAIFTSKNIAFQGSSHVRKEQIESFMECIHEKKNWIIDQKKERQIKESPPSILITSSLQQKAHQLLRYSPKATMKYAQELYENGYITYMRTDSACYSNEFIDSLKKHIIANFGEEYVRSDLSLLQQNKNKNKSQEAHEGIRVCNLSVPNADVKTAAASTLYRFIYKHSIQCAMSTCISRETVFKTFLDADLETKYAFQHTYKEILFPGWRKIDPEKKAESFCSYLSLLKESKTLLNLNYAEANETYVSTKSHYHEASLIQKLESMNIGRPSTYASIIQSLLDKKYVNKENIQGKELDVTQFVSCPESGITKKTERKSLHQEKNKLHITPIGKQVSEFCTEHFINVFNYEFTNTMETKLDLIEHGEVSQKETLKSFISTLDTIIQKTETVHENDPDKIKKVKDVSLHCGVYKKESMYIKNGKFGYYLCIGKRDKISLKEFNGFSIESKLSSQTNILTESEKQTLVDYINTRTETRHENMCVELSPICSIRKSKYGYYIFHQTKSMKKPAFLKYNDEKDDNTEERVRWIETQNKHKITHYVSKKYNITI